jgi:Zn-dependent protease with chaperone function
VNFFEAQDNARRTTRWLKLGYIFALSVVVVLVTCALIAAYVYIVPAIELFVANPWLDLTSISSTHYSLSSPYTRYVTDFWENAALIFSAVAVVVVIAIHMATQSKQSALELGGSVVAESVGGMRLPDASIERLHRRLRHVVEEMAIASGVPVPSIYVLEKEDGINAFAAGHSQRDAAIVVTQGALEQLKRDELQGLVAHEFSHIVNGDMALNTHAIGLLFGMSAVSFVGRWIKVGGKRLAKIGAIPAAIVLWPAGYVYKYISEQLGMVLGVPLLLIAVPLWLFSLIGVAIMIFGLAVFATGAFGLISARITRSAIARQREYLADASAIQFTRSPAGITNALRKIGGHRELSYVTAVDPEEISHMLFASGSKFSWTHPPLHKRIRELGSNVDETDYPRVEAPPEPVAVTEDSSAETLSSPIPGVDEGVLPEAITETVGQPGPAHLEYSRNLRKSIPANLYDAAHSLEMAHPLIIALILDRSGQQIEQQMTLVENRFSAGQCRLIQGYREDLANVGAEYRLPMLELALPILKRRPAAQLVELVEFADHLAKIDATVDLYEYCIGRILRLRLRDALDPSHSGRTYGPFERRRALANVLVVIARHGHANSIDGQAALDAAKPILGKWMNKTSIDVNQDVTLDALDVSLDILLWYEGKDFSKFMLAICTTAAHDGRLTLAEAELIRVVAATVDCPVPPILGANL